MDSSKLLHGLFNREMGVSIPYFVENLLMLNCKEYVTSIHATVLELNHDLASDIFNQQENGVSINFVENRSQLSYKIYDLYWYR